MSLISQWVSRYRDTREGTASMPGRSRRRRSVRSQPQVDFLEVRALLTAGVTQYLIGSGIPGVPGLPGGLAFTKDHTLWFTEQFNDRLGQFDPATGKVLAFYSVAPGTLPHNLKVLPDGTTLVFTGLGDYLNFFDTTTKTLTQLGTADGITPGSHPHDSILASDGNIYFTEQVGNRMGEYNTTTHAITEYPLQLQPGPPPLPHGVANLPDGNIIVCEQGRDALAEFSPTTHTVVKVYTGMTPGSFPHDPVLAPDGKTVYFTEYFGNRIGKLDLTTGQITEVPTSLAPFDPMNPGGNGPNLITIINGPDGHSIWFPEFLAGRIGKLDTNTGQITEYKTGIAPTALPLVLTLGPDGNIWFSEPGTQSIAKLVPSQADQFVNQPNRGYPASLYQDLLGISVDNPGTVSFFTNLLDTGKANSFQVAEAISGSHSAHVLLVKSAFEALLSRAPSQKELDHSVRFMDQGGDFGQVEAQIMGTKEYFTKRGGGTDSGFLNAIYSDILHRTPSTQDQFIYNAALASLGVVHPVGPRLTRDPSHIGLAKQPSRYPSTFAKAVAAQTSGLTGPALKVVTLSQLQTQLSHGVPRSQIAAKLLFSSEGAAVEVRNLFQLLLSRPATVPGLPSVTLIPEPDANTVSFYSNALMHGTSANVIIAALASSADYSQLRIVGPTPTPPGQPPAELLEV